MIVSTRITSMRLLGVGGNTPVKTCDRIEGRKGPLNITRWNEAWSVEFLAFLMRPPGPWKGEGVNYLLAASSEDFCSGVPKCTRMCSVETYVAQ